MGPGDDFFMALREHPLEGHEATVITQGTVACEEGGAPLLRASFEMVLTIWHSLRIPRNYQARGTAPCMITKRVPG